MQKGSQKLKRMIEENNVLTRTWILPEPRWWPKASCGKSLGADLLPLGAPSQRPDTGETAKKKTKKKQTLHNENNYQS